MFLYNAQEASQTVDFFEVKSKKAPRIRKYVN
jgi:hypothetical protein